MLEECTELTAGMRLSKATPILQSECRWKVRPDCHPLCSGLCSTTEAVLIV